MINRGQTAASIVNNLATIRNVKGNAKHGEIEAIMATRSVRFVTYNPSRPSYERTTRYAAANGRQASGW